MRDVFLGHSVPGVAQGLYYRVSTNGNKFVCFQETVIIPMKKLLQWSHLGQCCQDLRWWQSHIHDGYYQFSPVTACRFGHLFQQILTKGPITFKNISTTSGRNFTFQKTSMISGHPAAVFRRQAPTPHHQVVHRHKKPMTGRCKTSKCENDNTQLCWP